MRWRRGDLGGWAIYRGVLVFYYFGHQINVAKVASGREEKKVWHVDCKRPIGEWGDALQHIHRNRTRCRA